MHTCMGRGKHGHACVLVYKRGGRGGARDGGGGGHTDETPPSTGPLLRGGGHTHTEGIRIGTSDRFGRGRGEFLKGYWET